MLRLNKQYVIPELYLKAAGELLFILLALCWAITMTTGSRAFVANNPLLDRVGYNNLCIGFDTSPAREVGQLLYYPLVYMAIRFAWTDMQRTKLTEDQLTPGVARLAMWADVLYMISVCVFGLIFVVPPMVSMWGHTFLFHQYILARLLVAWTNIYEYNATRTVATKTWCFMWVYTVASIGSVLCCELSYAMFDLHNCGRVQVGSNCMPDLQKPQAPYIPWYITAFFDYLWFVCLAVGSFYMPLAEVICLTFEIKELDSLPSYSKVDQAEEEPGKTTAINRIPRKGLACCR